VDQIIVLKSNSKLSKEIYERGLIEAAKFGHLEIARMDSFKGLHFTS